MTSIRCLIFASFLALQPAPAVRAESRSADEIDSCIRKNRPTETSVLEVSFRSKDRIGGITEKSGTLSWKRFDGDLSRLVLRFRYPNDVRGAAVLLIEAKERAPEMFMCIPALQKVRRVTTRTVSSSLFGTDFSYEDFQRLQGYTASVSKLRLEDAVLADRPAFVVERTLEPDAGSAYGRIVDFVDQETCLPLRTESYERGGRLRKVLTADPAAFEFSGSVWVARSMLMRDLLDETETALLVEKVEIDTKLNRKVFSTRDLEARCR